MIIFNKIKSLIDLITVLGSYILCYATRRLEKLIRLGYLQLLKKNMINTNFTLKQENSEKIQLLLININKAH